MQSRTLYEKDYYGWIQHNIELLRAGQWSEIDIDLLTEELDDMGKRDKRELVSHLTILLLHLLKWQFQYRDLADRWQEFEGKSWRNTIIEQRKQISKQLAMSPSLKPYLPEALLEAYEDGLDLAVKETGLARTVFPDTCPYEISQILDDDFYPTS